MIKELREATGAGILDSKKALEANDGNFDKAVEFLREKGLASAAKKSSREANDGLVAARISEDGSTGAMIEVNCETDFVARTDDFSEFVKQLLQQAFSQPVYASVDAFLASSVNGSADQTVAEAVKEAIGKLGENIIVRRLVKYALDGEGTVDAYIHSNNRVGVLVELQTEGTPTDRSALQELAHDVALQIAAANPQYVSPDEVPANIVEEERKIYLAQLAEDKKPEEIKARIVDGRLKKFYQEVTLLEQSFGKDDSLSIHKLLQQAKKTVGTPVTIRRFSRFEIGVS
jgi:elongation factor Ts